MAIERCSQEEIEKERTPFELRTWLNPKVEQICSTKEGLKDFRLQKGYIKQLVEEISPLAIFGKHKFGDTSQVFLQPVIGNQNYDAKVIDKRTKSASVTYVEITQAHEGEDDYWRRCELLEKGFVFSHAPVIKTGKGRNRMVSIPPKAIEVEERGKNELSRILDAAEKKAGKNYPANSALLIFFDDTAHFQEVMDNNKLDSFVNDKVLKLDLRFSALYLVGRSVFREYPIN